MIEIPEELIEIYEPEFQEGKGQLASSAYRPTSPNPPRHRRSSSRKADGWSCVIGVYDASRRERAVIASIVWESHDVPRRTPGSGTATRLRLIVALPPRRRPGCADPVVVVCKRCGAWLVVVHEYADDERTVGAFLVVREKHAEMVRRVQPEHAFIVDTSSSTLSQTAEAGERPRSPRRNDVSVVADVVSEGRTATAMSTAAIRSALDTAQRTDTARTVRHY